MDSIEPKIGISKYCNMGGVTCYMNSILAILQQTPIFADYIVDGSFYKYLMKNIKIKKSDDFTEKLLETVTFNIYRLFFHSLSSDDASITPTSFRRSISKINPIWGEYAHQDSQELFNFIIMQLEEEQGISIDFLPGRKKLTTTIDPKTALVRIKAKKMWETFIKREFSPLKLMFTGLQHGRQKCKLCKTENNSFQTFTTLQINIPIKEGFFSTKEYTLDECLEHTFQDEVLDYENRMKCDFCCRKNRATKMSRIWRPPKIMVIHIKRFKMNMYGMITSKIDNKVNFPVLDLDISKYISEESPHKDKCKYNLFGVNIHHSMGYSSNINAGHYVSVIKNRLDNKWYLFNDSASVKSVIDVDGIKHKNAYLLFYYRTN